MKFLVCGLKLPLQKGSPSVLSFPYAPVYKEGSGHLTLLALLPCRYLEEVGYTDTILDMRSKRVRSLLGRSLEINGTVEPSEGGPRATPGPGGLSGGESLLVKQIEEQIKR